MALAFGVAGARGGPPPPPGPLHCSVPTLDGGSRQGVVTRENFRHAPRPAPGRGGRASQRRSPQLGSSATLLAPLPPLHFHNNVLQCKPFSFRLLPPPPWLPLLLQAVRCPASLARHTVQGAGRASPWLALPCLALPCRLQALRFAHSTPIAAIAAPPRPAPDADLSQTDTPRLLS